MSLTKTYNLK